MGDGPATGGPHAAELLSGSVVHLHPEDAVVQAMLRGWRAQMAARALSAGTVESRLSVVQRFADFSGEYPWQWRAADVDDWSVELRGRGLSSSTLRAYQGSLRQFCDYLVDPRYEWGEVCWELFGSHPVQVCHEWNTTAHVAEVEARPQVRPLTRGEVEAFFDYADEQVAVRARQGRKGWAAAWRDAALFKVIYAFGLRRREAAMLELVDFGSNPKAPEFGAYGLVTSPGVV
ncbi:tyrosine-type recombinase/integrase [Thalassiella azotivora]